MSEPKFLVFSRTGSFLFSAFQLFELEGVVSRDCCRIVKYDDYQDTLECSFDEEEDTTMEKLLGGIKQSYSFDLLLETKRPEQKFQAYKPGGRYKLKD